MHTKQENNTITNVIRIKHPSRIENPKEAVTEIMKKFKNNDFYDDDIWAEIIQDAKSTPVYDEIIALALKAKSEAQAVVISNVDFRRKLAGNTHSEWQYDTAAVFCGLFHFYGINGPRDYLKAEDYFSMAADLDNYNAHSYLGSIGLIRHDYTKAEQYFQKAVLKGHLDAMLGLGSMLIKRKDQSLDYAYGILLLEDAAKRGLKAADLLLRVTLKDQSVAKIVEHNPDVSSAAQANNETNSVEHVKYETDEEESNRLEQDTEDYILHEHLGFVTINTEKPLWRKSDGAPGKRILDSDYQVVSSGPAFFSFLKNKNYNITKNNADELQVKLQTKSV